MSPAALSCNASGPGLAPDPRIGCQREEGHEGRHRWREGQQKIEWGSAGPGPEGCAALPVLVAAGDEIPHFHCTRDPDHEGAHHWEGATLKGTDAAVDWIGGQMVILIGPDVHMADEATSSNGTAGGTAPAGEGAAPASAANPVPAARSTKKRAPAKKAAKKVAAAKKGG
jgi:hypothetical protein